MTDRSDASGTGYFDGRANSYRRDLLMAAFGKDVVLPRVLQPSEPAAQLDGILIGPGAGDNAAAALGVQAGDDVVVSLGTSGTAFARSQTQPSDATGAVAGFCDTLGAFLPLVCTLNAARVLDGVAGMLGVDLSALSDLALKSTPGAEGLRLVPYFDGERTPNLPEATGALHGLTLSNLNPQNVARATIEGMLCGLADGVDALSRCGVSASRVQLIGGAAQSRAVREIAPTVFGLPVVAPEPGEYVADGAARQAAWVLAGAAAPPEWAEQSAAPAEYRGPSTTGLRERYAEAAARYLNR